VAAAPPLGAVGPSAGPRRGVGAPRNAKE